MHHLQELGCALLIASPYLLPKRLEPLRIVAVTVFASVALHVTIARRGAAHAHRCCHGAGPVG